jgi:hypothetical protein
MYTRVSTTAGMLNRNVDRHDTYVSTYRSHPNTIAGVVAIRPFAVLVVVRVMVCMYPGCPLRCRGKLALPGKTPTLYSSISLCKNAGQGKNLDDKRHPPKIFRFTL